jgi:hypothetical protein
MIGIMDVLFLVTSLVKPKDAYNSVFSTEERFQQTIHTINTIKNKVPHALIVVLEASHGPKTLVMFNDVFMFYIDHDLIDNPYSKSMGEAKILQIFLTSDCYKNLTKTSNYMVFKISGRYFLDDNFDMEKFHPDKINCRIIDTKNDPNDIHDDNIQTKPDICTVTSLFSFPSKITEVLLKRLEYVIDTIPRVGSDINHHIFKHVPNLYNIDLIGIAGTQTTGRFVKY